MRAFQLIAPGRAEVRDIPEPDPRPGEVLLSVTAAGVCHSDLHILHLAGDAFPMPMTFGHEVAGTVAAVGPGGDRDLEGQSVLVYMCWGCGRCRACAVGAENYCHAYPRATVPGGGLGFNGGMAEQVVVPTRQLVPLDDLDPAAAAPLADAALTPYHALALARSRTDAGAAVVVIGLGGLGHMAIQLLRETTGCTIIAVDTDEGRLRRACELGAHHGVLSDGRAAEEILGRTRGCGAQVVFDFVGVQATIDLAAATVASLGTISIVGLGMGEQTFRAAAPPIGLPWGACVMKPYGGTRRELHDVVALARQGRIAADIERHPLGDAGAVFESLARGQVAGRAVLVPEAAGHRASREYAPKPETVSQTVSEYPFGSQVHPSGRGRCGIADRYFGP